MPDVFTVTTNDGTIEVAADAITPPEGWQVLPQARLNAMDAQAKRKARSSLSRDEEFRLQIAAEIAESAGITISDDGQFVIPTPEGVDEEAIRDRIARQFEANTEFHRQTPEIEIRN